MGSQKLDQEDVGRGSGSGESSYSIREMLTLRGVSRRDFLKFCSVMTAALELAGVCEAA